MNKTFGKAALWATILLGIPGLIWAAAWLSSGEPGLFGIGPWGRPAAFMVTLFLMTVFCLLTGKAVTGLWRGLLIDERNRISLSRLQTAVWTIVVLSAIVVAAFSNVSIEAENRVPSEQDPAKIKEQREALDLPPGGPLDFPIPAELWVVLGISATSLVGSPLLLAPKKERSANAGEAVRTTRALVARGDTTLTNQGQVLVRNSPSEARWADIFQADEVGNGAHLDLGKVQNFYFTFILVFAYANSLYTMFALAEGYKPPHGIEAFPALSEGMVALLGISHAAYLANKARTHTQTEPGTPPETTDGLVNDAAAGATLRSTANLPPLSSPAPAPPTTGGGAGKP